MPVFGSFHLEMVFMNTIYKRFNGCGLSDLVVAAGLIEQGFVERALSGKHYKRCMRIHKLVYECLARRMIKEHLTNEGDVPILTAMATQFTDENEFSRKREIIDTMCNTQEFQNLIASSFDRINMSESENGRYWVTYGVI